MDVVESERGFVVVSQPRPVVDRVASVGSTSSFASTVSRPSFQEETGVPSWLEKSSSLLLCMHRPGRFSVWLEAGMGREVCTIEADVVMAEGEASCVGPYRKTSSDCTFRTTGSREPFLRMSRVPQLCGMSECSVLKRPDETEEALICGNWMAWLSSGMKILSSEGKEICEIDNFSSL